LFSRHGRAVFDYLTANGVIADWREPNVIRIAPVPLYNQFSDIYRLASLLAQFPG
jgi:kynureninase